VPAELMAHHSCVNNNRQWVFAKKKTDKSCKYAASRKWLWGEVYPKVSEQKLVSGIFE